MSMADLAALARSGQVRSTDLVREESWTSWQMAGALPELREIFAGAPIPQAAGFPGAAPYAPPYASPNPYAAPPPGYAAAPLAPLRRADIGIVFLLTVITLGIYSLIWFYGTMRSYRSIAQRPNSSAETLFWWYVVCIVCLVTLGWLWVGLIGYPASIVVGAILLSNVLQDREVACSRIGGVADLNSNTTHLVLWIVGQLIFAGCIGLILVIIQTVIFIRDHNRVVEEFRRRMPSVVAGG